MDESKQGLFRDQVVERQAFGRQGRVVLARPVSFRVLAMAAAGLAASLVGFLFWGSYTRTERATGVLWPEAGLVQVRAPQSGLVTALRVREGERVALDAPLLTLVPPETRLYAELYVTSRARGALRVEQPALLALRGFPPREYGFQHGNIQAISQAPLEPGDLLVPLPLVETVYRVRVTLESQFVRRGGAEYVLQPGMLLDAELPTERRRLIEWIFEPLLDLRDRSAV